jgi:ATP-dependent Lon protease
MEVIKLSGYFLEEKLAIAKNYVISKLLSETGISPTQLDITESALRKLIAAYCREPGVRSLQKYLEKITRKVALKIAKGDAKTLVITDQNLEEYAGKAAFEKERLYDDFAPPGVVTGLAYNQIGGALIWIESIVIKEDAHGHYKKDRLKVTGKLGSVMNESVEIAYSVAKQFAHNYTNFFDQV